MAEALVLAALGGGLGLLLATWGLDAVLAANPEPPPFWVQLALDARVVMFVLLVSIASAVLVGLIPAFRATRLDVVSGMQPGNRTAGATASQRWLQGLLVAGQVAMSLALLVGATLLARSAMQLGNADTGFDPRPLLSFRVYMAGDAYDRPIARATALDRLVGRIAALPGVSAAGATGAIPGDDGGQGTSLLPPDGRNVPGDEIGAMTVPVTPQFFDALGLSFIEGRTFTMQETTATDADVVVVNRRLAERFWPGQRADGRRLTLVGAAVTHRRVIGVVPDVVYEELGEETEQSRLIVYLPYAAAGWRTMAVLVRSAGDPGTLAASVRSAIRDVDPAFAIYDLLTMAERRVQTQWGERFIGRTFAAFAIVALLLACVGAYGLTAHAAAQRTREIGLRMAIGATRGDIIRLLLGRGIRLAALGIGAGLPAAAAGAFLLQGMLFRVSAWDPGFWLAVPLSLLVPVIVANFLPARRAARSDPAVALRHE
jgi:predicted permease